MPSMQSCSLGMFNFARASSRNNDQICHYDNFPEDFVQLKKEFSVRLQISFLILSEIKRINKLIFPLRSPENLWLTYGFLVISGEIEANQSKCPSNCLLLFWSIWKCSFANCAFYLNSIAYTVQGYLIFLIFKISLIF